MTTSPFDTFTKPKTSIGRNVTNSLTKYTGNDNRVTVDPAGALRKPPYLSTRHEQLQLIPKSRRNRSAQQIRIRRKRQ